MASGVDGPVAYDEALAATIARMTAGEVAALVRSLELERERLERTRSELVLREKLAALGELSEGVAHELNQPLTVIRMLAEILPMRPSSTIGEHARDLALLADATRRMTCIVEDVQAFARVPALRRVLVPADEPVSAALEVVADALAEAGVTLERVVPASVPMVALDPERMRQALANVLVNACHALEALEPSRPRTITLELVVSARAVAYRVMDDGDGVADVHASRLFDPFFTTRSPGKGTGLGLSVAHGIVREHGGTLRYEPRVPRGATFVIEIPRPVAEAP